MKQSQLAPWFLSATLFLAGAGAAVAEDTGTTTNPEPVREGRRAEIIKKFDRNGDGKLDETERAAAREAIRGNRKKGSHIQRAVMGKRDQAIRHGYIMGRFDTNRDGKLDDAEKSAVRAEAEQRMRSQMEKQLQRLKTVDADGDGKISDGEWAVARENFQKERVKSGQRGRQNRRTADFLKTMP